MMNEIKLGKSVKLIIWQRSVLAKEFINNLFYYDVIWFVEGFIDDYVSTNVWWPVGSVIQRPIKWII